MGTAIIAKDRDDEDGAIAMNVPVQRGLEYLGLLDTSVAKCAKNYALGKPNGIVVGEPTVGGGGSYFQFKTGSNYIATQTPEPFAFTFYAIVRSLDTLADQEHRPTYFGTYASLPLLEETSTVVGGLAARVAGVGTTITVQASRTPDGTTASASNESFTTAATGSAWNFIVGWGGAGAGVNSCKNYTTVATTASSNSYARWPSRAMINIGSGGTNLGGHAGTGEIQLFQLHSVVHSTQEMDDTVEWHRARLLRKFGVTGV